jgi:hypothetical protein
VSFELFELTRYRARRCPRNQSNHAAACCRILYLEINGAPGFFMHIHQENVCHLCTQPYLALRRCQLIEVVRFS